MKIIIIAAVAKNLVIGKGEKIPWHSKEDFLHFKRKTLDNVVLMGRKTYQSMGKALPQRKNIVISRELESLPDAEVFKTYEEGLERAKDYAREKGIDLFIIGGGSIYKRGLEDADKLYISKMKGEFEGDIFFPEFESSNKWVIESKEEFQDFTFEIWKRK